MILLNNFSSETTWQISTKFHVKSNVETGWRVCSNGHTPSTVMPIFSKKSNNKNTFSSSKARTAQIMIFSVIAVTILKKMLPNLCISAMAMLLK